MVVMASIVGGQRGYSLVPDGIPFSAIMVHGLEGRMSRTI
jgi:hypothetical protein